MQQSNWMDIIGYGCLAPIPLWIFLGIIYFIVLGTVNGPVCDKCQERHNSLSCPPTPPKSQKQKKVSPWLLVALLGGGAVIVFIVQFTPY